MTVKENKGAVLMDDDELAQVQGGLVFNIGTLNTLEGHLGCGKVVTLEEKFSSLANMTTLELKAIPFWDRRYRLAQEYLKYLNDQTGKAETVSL